MVLVSCEHCMTSQLLVTERELRLILQVLDGESLTAEKCRNRRLTTPMYTVSLKEDGWTMRRKSGYIVFRNSGKALFRVKYAF